MRFVTVSEDYMNYLAKDDEILFRENRRPHLLLLTLSYKGISCRFAAPLRSNINTNQPKKHYFSLPPRPTTRSGNCHGVHYIKMFPIPKECQEKFWVGGKPSYEMYQRILSRNEKRIVEDAQKYLDEYAAGCRPPFSVDLDMAFERMNEYLEIEKEKQVVAL